MVGYGQHNQISYRLRSGGVDVPLGTAPYTQFVRFDELSDAKAFIDTGRHPEGLTVYDMATQAPVQVAA